MNKRLFVAGIPFTSTSEDLKTLFAGVGQVVSATIIMDRESGRSKGFGFIEMETPEEAANAIAKLNDTDFGGRKLIVAEAKPQEPRSDRPQRSYGNDRRGGFGGRDDSGRREGGRGSFGRPGGRGGRGTGRGGFSR